MQRPIAVRGAGEDECGAAGYEAAGSTERNARLEKTETLGRPQPHPRSQKPRATTRVYPSTAGCPDQFPSGAARVEKSCLTPLFLGSDSRLSRSEVRRECVLSNPWPARHVQRLHGRLRLGCQGGPASADCTNPAAEGDTVDCVTVVIAVRLLNHVVVAVLKGTAGSTSMDTSLLIVERSSSATSAKPGSFLSKADAWLAVLFSRWFIIQISVVACRWYWQFSKTLDTADTPLPGMLQLGHPSHRGTTSLHFTAINTFLS